MANNKVTVRTLVAMKDRGEVVVFLTAYDYPTAAFADRAGADMLLVGDSAAMTMLGCSTTLEIGMGEMLIFARAVTKAAKRAFVVGDLPFLSYQPSDAAAVRNAGRFIKAGCDAVKCEGGARIASRVRAMADAGIAVMGHLGLTPQSLGPLGGYRVQGKSLAAAEALAQDAIRLEEAGAFAILIEAVPAETAGLVCSAVRVPVYGIGSGPQVDGQLVISHDILGNFVGDVKPRFVKRYADLDRVMETAFRNYAAEVRSRAFPAPEHEYRIDSAEENAIRKQRLAAATREAS
jgi:3-methyl-2-oxobutanoate hydroxymethyltransferase